MARDLPALSELSHRLEQVALDLAGQGFDARLIAHELGAVAASEREAIAIALSYLLRHRSLDTVDDRDVLTNAIDAMVLTLRRTPPPF